MHQRGPGSAQFTENQHHRKSEEVHRVLVRLEDLLPLWQLLETLFPGPAPPQRVPPQDPRADRQPDSQAHQGHQVDRKLH